MALGGLLASLGSLEGYPLVAAVRGDLLERLGRHDEARAEFGRASMMTANASEQALFRNAEPRCREAHLSTAEDCQQQTGRPA